MENNDVKYCLRDFVMASSELMEFTVNKCQICRKKNEEFCKKDNKKRLSALKRQYLWLESFFKAVQKDESNHFGRHAKYILFFPHERMFFFLRSL